MGGIRNPCAGRAGAYQIDFGLKEKRAANLSIVERLG